MWIWMGNEHMKKLNNIRQYSIPNLEKKTSSPKESNTNKRNYLNNPTICQLLIQHPVLVHDPICSVSFWGMACVENESFYHPDNSTIVRNLSILPSRFPIPAISSTIHSSSICIFCLLRAKEEPFKILTSQMRFIWQTKQKQIYHPKQTARNRDRRWKRTKRKGNDIQNFHLRGFTREKYNKRAPSNQRDTFLK